MNAVDRACFAAERMLARIGYGGTALAKGACIEIDFVARRDAAVAAAR